tara:strand:- start:5 stop:778 length:774 start_codon:yes stop_codon:yes gene_type:complete
MLINKFFIFLTISSLIFSCSSNKIKPDFDRETMIYEQNLSEIFDGEHYYQNYLYGKFSSIKIYNENYKAAILYLHGRGLNPNEQNLAYPIRTQMSNTFNTYSIQLPVLKKESTYFEYTKIFYDSDERIKSTIENILSANNELIIIAHSCGVHMLMSYIRNHTLSSHIKSIILIGSGAVDKGQSLLKPYPYDKISVPVLDIYGENDFSLVLKKSKDRREFIEDISSKSKQIEIKLSNHYHDDNSSEIIDQVKKWLSTL